MTGRGGGGGSRTRMDVLGIDISKQTLDVALLRGGRVRQAMFSNTEDGFADLECWLARHRPDPETSMHAGIEATGNYRLDLAEVLHERGVVVSIVKAHGQAS